MSKPPNATALRVRCLGTNDGLDFGFRFYVKYSGGPATEGDVEKVATRVGTELGNQTSVDTYFWNSAMTFTEVEVTDLSSETGKQYVKSISHTGTRTGTPTPALLALRVSFTIARRYRGGHPGVYLPGGVTTDIEDPTTWSAAVAANAKLMIEELIEQAVTTPEVTISSLTGVNVSLYSGHTKIYNEAKDTYKYPPKPREAALYDTIENYVANRRVSTQKRRRTATSF